MKPKRIVITGGPGTGKSTLIKQLEKSGHPCLHEVSREVILKARKEGIEQLFLQNPLLFSEMVLAGRLKQFQELSQSKEDLIFYDRGLHDVLAYLHYFDKPFPEKMHQTCENHSYDMVFILPPWKEIYSTDNERYESFEEAIKIHFHLENTYKNYKYTPIEVPKLPIAQRLSFILKKVKNKL